MAKKKQVRKSTVKKQVKLSKRSYDPLNRSYLIIIGAVIAVLLVLFVTFVISRSKLTVENKADYIDVTPEAVIDSEANRN